MSWDKGNKHVVNKSSRCMTLINRAAKAKATPFWRFLNRHLYSSWDSSRVSDGVGPKEGIALIQGQQVRCFEGNTVHFEHLPSSPEAGASPASSVDVDVVVLATGYSQQFPFLRRERRSVMGKEEEGKDSTDDNNEEEEEKEEEDTLDAESESSLSCSELKEEVEEVEEVEVEDVEVEDALPREHFVLNPEEPRLAFFGFVRPNVGAIPPMAELQAMWWCVRLDETLGARYRNTEALTTRALARKVRWERINHGHALKGGCWAMPGLKAAPYYKLSEHKIGYAVDYGTYMFALAKEMGAVPNLFGRWWWRSPRVCFAVALGQAHAPIFRLDGPFQTQDAESVCATELMIPIMRRPLGMHAAFVGNATFFGILNVTIAAVTRLFRYSCSDFACDMCDLAAFLRDRCIFGR